MSPGPGDNRVMEAADDPPPFDGREFVRELTVAPGVYRMIGADGSALYVGKAMSLKKRVANYFRADQPSPRIAAMVAQIASIEITITRTPVRFLESAKRPSKMVRAAFGKSRPRPAPITPP